MLIKQNIYLRRFIPCFQVAQRMPKVGKGQKNWLVGRHPDKMGARNVRGVGETRRVSFKGSNRISKRNVRRERQVHIRHLLDQDIDMGTNILDGETNNSRGNPYVRGRGGYKRGNRHEHGKLVDHSGWFRASIPYGAKYIEPALLGVLQSHIAPLELVPLAYRVENDDAVFFLDNLKTAEALQDADLKVNIGDGALSVKVCSGIPWVEMDDTLKERIKQAMVKRYNINTKALDLARFHRDPELIKDTCCAMTRCQVLKYILQVIADNIPELEALNLTSNCLYLADTLKNLPRKVPNLKILYIGNNRFRDLSRLSILKALPLVELKLEGNPLCQKYSKEEYTREIRKIFTKIVRLDGVDLPPVTSFDVEDDPKKVPPSQESFLCSKLEKSLCL
jgi:nuclear RNA export factor